MVTLVVTPNRRRILAEVKEKAQAGDPRSQLTYGLLLEMRDDMNVAQEAPLDWFVRAAQGGLPPAQYLVGMHMLAAVVWGAGERRQQGSRVDADRRRCRAARCAGGAR